jgi:hypothetical protein
MNPPRWPVPDCWIGFQAPARALVSLSFNKEFVMALPKNGKTPAGKPAISPSKRLVKVPLDKLVLRPETFSHRQAAALDRASLKPSWRASRLRG